MSRVSNGVKIREDFTKLLIYLKYLSLKDEKGILKFGSESGL